MLAWSDQMVRGRKIIDDITLDKTGSPDTPAIDNIARMTEGASQRLSCDADNAYPEGDIAWYINGMNITQTTATNTLKSDFRYNISSDLNYDPMREHNGEELVCRATHQSGNVEKKEVLDVQCK